MGGKIDERLEKGATYRIEHGAATVLGRDIGKGIEYKGAGNLYVAIVDLQTKEMQKESFPETLLLNPFKKLHRLNPEIQENIRRTQNYYALKQTIKQKNIDDMDEETKKQYFNLLYIQASSWNNQYQF